MARLVRRIGWLALVCVAAGIVVGCDVLGDYEDKVPGLPLDALVQATPDTAPEVFSLPAERPEHCADKLSPGPAPVRRLTLTEYNNTVRDLTGDTSRPADGFPPEEEALGFDNNASGRSITNIHVERYLEAAERLVVDMLENRWGSIVTCDPEDNGVLLCAEWTIERFGALAYRRPLTDEEAQRYRDYFELNFNDLEGDFAGALRMVFEVMLQSPHFLYRLELGSEDSDGDGVVALTSNEIAVRLSYLLWNSAPDDLLLSAAVTGKLDRPDGIAEEARRLLAHERARDAVLHFHRQWLQLNKLQDVFKDDGLFPEFTPALRAAMGHETETYVTKIIFEGAGDLKTLLTGPFSYLNDDLARHYGLEAQTVDGVGEAARPQKDHTLYELDPQTRAGIFTQGAILSTHAKYNQTSPVLRGKFVREQIMCDHLQPPPANVDITPPKLDPTLTTRERFAEHSNSPACSGCHKRMEPLGFTFENYDAIGRWRTMETGGQLIDPSGEVLFSWDVDGPVESAVDLAQTLAESSQSHDCYITQWFRYTHARDVTMADECTIFDLRKAFTDSGLDIQALLVAFTQTEAFRYRPVVQATGLVAQEPDNE